MLTPSVWIMVTALLQLGTQFSSCTQSSQNARELEHDAELCKIRSSFPSPFVKAYHMEPAAALTCNYSGVLSPSSSSSSSSLPRKEVHVVYLQIPSNNQSEGKRHRVPQVLLNVVTSNENAIRNLDLVFVLDSNQTVSWKIVSDCIYKARHVYFWVSNNCRIIPVTDPSVKIRRFETKGNLQSLGQWATEKFNHVTTIKEHELTRRITKSVGLGKGEACTELHRNEAAQETTGCIVPANQGLNNKDVHIFELEMHDKGSSAIILDVHAQSKVSLRRHLLLVLKAHRPTRWMVRTSRLRGTLDIITDQTVDTNSIDMQSVRVVNERLANLSGSDLITWTAVNYGAPVSYTGARLASRFDLTVDGVDDKWQLGGDKGQDSSSTSQSDGLLLDRIRTIAEQSRSVSCFPGAMEVSLLKTPLSAFRLSTDHLSLDDPDCVPQQNSTHYFWTTRLEACGGVQRRLADRIMVENAILIRPMKPPVSQSLDDFSGSGMKQTDEGDGIYETFSDDEDVTRSSVTVIRLNFACTYPLDSDFPTDVDYYLRLYKDALFQHEIISFPVIVGVNQSLYVMAGIHTDQGLQANIENCSVFPVAVPGLVQHPLINSGCTVDKTVTWKDDGAFADEVPGERFEFLFQKWWDGHTRVDLRCDLTVCNRLTNHKAGIPQCQPRTARHCETSAGQHSSELKQNPLAKKLEIGPLILHSGVNSSYSSGRVSQVVSVSEPRQPPMAAEDEELCDQVVRIEGLDSPTVVGIAFAAFLIGALLSGTLWYIHSRTGPPKKHKLRRRSAETSGESTPSSTAPITVCQTVNQV